MDRHSLRRAELSWEGNTLVFTNYEDPTAPTAAYLTTLDGWYGGVGILSLIHISEPTRPY